MNRFLRTLCFGFASVLSIYPPRDTFLEKKLYHPERTDYEALCGDWVTIGNDMYGVLEQVSHEPG